MNWRGTTRLQFRDQFTPGVERPDHRIPVVHDVVSVPHDDHPDFPAVGVDAHSLRRSVVLVAQVRPQDDGRGAVPFPTWRASTGTTCPASNPFYGRPRAAASALWVPDYEGFAPGGGSAWTVYSQEGELAGRVTASEIDIIVLAAHDGIAAVLTWDELGVQTVELRRILEQR